MPVVDCILQPKFLWSRWKFRRILFSILADFLYMVICWVLDYKARPLYLVFCHSGSKQDNLLALFGSVRNETGRFPDIWAKLQFAQFILSFSSPWNLYLNPWIKDDPFALKFLNMYRTNAALEFILYEEFVLLIFGWEFLGPIKAVTSKTIVRIKKSVYGPVVIVASSFGRIASYAVSC